MQFPAVPGYPGITPLGWAFMALIGAWLPFAAVRQQRHFADARRLPPRSRLYASAIVMHGLFVVFVWAAARTMRINFLASYRLTPGHALIGLAALALGLLPLHPRLQFNNPTGRERARHLAPRTRGEHAAFYAVCLTAGFAEELAYRGMLFTLLATVIGGWWIPALLASVSFGLMHLFQGWKSASLAGVAGLREHIVVGLTGTLAVAMAVHVLHDMITGTVIAARVRRAANDAVAPESPGVAHVVS